MRADHSLLPVEHPIHQALSALPPPEIKGTVLYGREFASLSPN